MLLTAEPFLLLKFRACLPCFSGCVWTCKEQTPLGDSKRTLSCMCARQRECLCVSTTDRCGCGTEIDQFPRWRLDQTLEADLSPWEHTAFDWLPPHPPLLHIFSLSRHPHMLFLLPGFCEKGKTKSQPMIGPRFPPHPPYSSFHPCCLLLSRVLSRQEETRPNKVFLLCTDIVNPLETLEMLLLSMVTN